MLPQLKEIKQSKLTIDAFKGLCHKENVPIGAFYDMKNMACDDYPVLSTRGHRGLGDRLEDASGLTAGKRYIGSVTTSWYIQAAASACPWTA